VICLVSYNLNIVAWGTFWLPSKGHTSGLALTPRGFRLDGHVSVGVLALNYTVYALTPILGPRYGHRRHMLTPDFVNHCFQNGQCW